jgi:hypothetical protein
MDDLPSRRRDSEGRKPIGNRNQRLPGMGRKGYGSGIIVTGVPDIGIPMLSFGKKPVYLCCGFTDFRKSINGLMYIIQNDFQLDPFIDALFVFCNKSRNRIKILEWDTDGFWLYYKRLERGHFSWPKDGNDKKMSLTSEELSCLIGSAKLEKKLKHNEVFERKIS